MVDGVAILRELTADNRTLQLGQRRLLTDFDWHSTDWVITDSVDRSIGHSSR